MAKRVVIDEQTKEFYEEKAETLLKNYLATGNEMYRLDHEEIIKVLNSAKVIGSDEKDPNTVYVGSKVSVDIMGDIENFTLVIGKVCDFGTEASINSPVGECILGEKVGQTLSYEVRGNRINLKIVSVENDLESASEK